MRDLERVVASMAAACARGRRAARHRRHQGGGPGQGRRDLRQHLRRRPRARRRAAWGRAGRRPGDAVLVSGPVGDHGIAVMAAREGIDFETTLVSDSAPVVALVRRAARRRARHARPARPDARRPGDRAVRDRPLLERRDPPRGGRDPGAARRCAGPASCWASTRSTWPARAASSRSCPATRAEAALAAIRSQPGGEGARRIGSVVAEDPGRLVLRTRIGSHRLLERLSGEQLPRIC